MPQHKILSQILSLSLLTCLSASLLSGCATGQTQSTPDIVTVDRVFTATAIRVDDLQTTVTDIQTRYAGGPITILVRYFLQPPYSASKELAFSQGETVQDFLKKQDIQAPFDIVVSPTDVPPNQIWISYLADRSKGDGVYLSSPDVKDTASETETPDAPMSRAEILAVPKSDHIFSKPE